MADMSKKRTSFLLLRILDLGNCFDMIVYRTMFPLYPHIEMYRNQKVRCLLFGCACIQNNILVISMCLCLFSRYGESVQQLVLASGQCTRQTSYFEETYTVSHRGRASPHSSKKISSSASVGSPESNYLNPKRWIVNCASNVYHCTNDVDMIS